MLIAPPSEQDHIQGSLDSPVVIVEYGDYECSYCAQAAPILAQLKQQYGDELGFVFRNFPISNIHPDAYSAATLAEYAATQGKFWEVHDLLYENQDLLEDPQSSQELFDAIVQRFNFDADAAKKAIENREYDEKISEDIESGLLSGVNGTPAIFINGELLEYSYGQLPRMMKEILG